MNNLFQGFKFIRAYIDYLLIFKKKQIMYINWNLLLFRVYLKKESSKSRNIEGYDNMEAQSVVCTKYGPSMCVLRFNPRRESTPAKWQQNKK